jgi:hypothetical protein
MPYSIDCQARNFDLQRDLAWTNSDAWMFEQARPRPHIRSAMARALRALASHLTPRIQQPADQPYAAHTELRRLQRGAGTTPVWDIAERRV